MEYSPFTRERCPSNKNNVVTVFLSVSLWLRLWQLLREGYCVYRSPEIICRTGDAGSAGGGNGGVQYIYPPGKRMRRPKFLGGDVKWSGVGLWG